MEEQHLQGLEDDGPVAVSRYTVEVLRSPSVPCAQREDAMTAAKERGAYDAGRGYLSRSETSAAAVLRRLRTQLPEGPLIGLLLGPVAGLVIWWLPLGLESVAHRAIAILGLMLIYWMTEALDHGLTALLGCLLFWLLHVAPPAVDIRALAPPHHGLC